MNASFRAAWRSRMQCYVEVVAEHAHHHAASAAVRLRAETVIL